MNKPKFGAFYYSNSLNLGDEIQTLAAMQYLPQVDYFIDRDNIDDINSKILATEAGPVYTICNGWFDGDYCRLPYHPSIRPLFTSVHVNEEKKCSSYRCLDRFKTNEFISMVDPRNAEYYSMYGPVGCRDMNTLNKFRSAGIESYFSGCLTLTLKNPNPSIERSGVYVMDADSISPDLFYRYVPKSIRDDATYLRQSTPELLSRPRKMEMARELLDTYSKARLVITSRLHCVLPCIAMDTPVVFMHPNPSDCRFSGLLDGIDFISPDSQPEIDWNDVQNPTSIQDISHSIELLRKTVENFVSDAHNNKNV